MSNFWEELQKPIFALAPMEDVTDTSFREVVAGISSPEYLDILYTEFTSVDGMNHPKGKIRVGERLIVSESERKLLKQKNIRLAAENYLEENDIISAHRFDIIAVVKGEKFEIEHFEDAFYPFDVL